MRGTGEGHRPWDGAPNSTMTNGTVGATVEGVDGPVVTVQYKDGEKKIIIGPNVPIVRYEIADIGTIRPGALFTAVATGKAADGRSGCKLQRLAFLAWPLLRLRRGAATKETLS
jgi:hypothetical protein